MKEQPLFCVGDKAVCVDSSNCEGMLIEGKVYKVSTMRRCDGCGGISIGVGIMYLGNAVRSRCRCGYTSKVFPEYGFRQTRFVPLDTNSQLEESIFEALKGHVEILKG